MAEWIPVLPFRSLGRERICGAILSRHCFSAGSRALTAHCTLGCNQAYSEPAISENERRDTPDGTSSDVSNFSVCTSPHSHADRARVLVGRTLCRCCNSQSMADDEPAQRARVVFLWAERCLVSLGHLVRCGRQVRAAGCDRSIASPGCDASQRHVDSLAPARADRVSCRCFRCVGSRLVCDCILVCRGRQCHRFSLLGIRRDPLRWHLATGDHIRERSGSRVLLRGLVHVRDVMCSRWAGPGVGPIRHRDAVRFDMVDAGTPNPGRRSLMSDDFVLPGRWRGSRRGIGTPG